jgi:vacuolar-type H+-ATPase subunit C/Vma6
MISLADIGKIIQFDRAHYEQLINFLKGIDDNVNTDPMVLGTTADLKLDNSLATRLKPGSQNWDIAKNLAAQAGVFGNSAHQRYTSVEAELRAFAKALKDAEDVFEDTDDLATYDAGKFAQEHPDVGGSTA